MNKVNLYNLFSTLDFSVDWSYHNKELEFSVNDEDGDVDYDRTEEVLELLQKCYPGLGGYRTGYGAWVLREDYSGHTGDYNDPSSSYHY